ncbi:hypothetical protein, partial [Alcanivorax sp.]|uniref:hypothetical protein n=1 Tax=Alcanivorax sp. TaxID=1872427 RepID=UPI002356E7A7
VQLLCFVATDRVVPFPSVKAQQMCPSGRAFMLCECSRVFQAGPHSLLQFLDGSAHTFKIAPRLRVSLKD